MTPRRFVLGLLAVPLAVAVTAMSVDGQQMDQRWLPFIGCWEPVDADAEAGLVCVRPFEEGVELLGVASGEVVSRDVMVADGVMRALSDEECDASEAVEFSADGWRVFSHSEFSCEGEVSQSGSGVISLVAPTQWIDVRSIRQGDEEVAWVQGYTLVGPDRVAVEGIEDPTTGAGGLSLRNARMIASGGLELEDVEEASGRVDAKAVEAWVAATRDRFDVSAEELVRLADSGVPESVIDVVVAVSFPDRFAIDAEGEAAAQRKAPRGMPVSSYGYRFRSPFWSPYFGVGLGYGYSPYGYSPIGYGYGSSFGYGYAPYGYTTRVEVTTRSAPRGRLINGRGYRGTSGGSGSAQPGGSGSGGSSAAPSSGSSGGSGSTPARRTAKRRPPPGG